MDKRQIHKRMGEIFDEIANLSKELQFLYSEINFLESKHYSDDLYKSYLNERKYGAAVNSYGEISIKVASYLKEVGVPVRTKDIFESLNKNENISISYHNFVSNYLNRMKTDNNIKVENVVRGYWQYKYRKN